MDTLFKNGRYYNLSQFGDFLVEQSAYTLAFHLLLTSLFFGNSFLLRETEIATNALPYIYYVLNSRKV